MEGQEIRDLAMHQQTLCRAILDNIFCVVCVILIIYCFL